MARSYKNKRSHKTKRCDGGMVFIIAECGVNWRALSEAATLIKNAARCGVDAVKFQAFTREQVFSHPAFEDYLKDIIMTQGRAKYLASVARKNRVEFMCTPMYPEAVDMLDPYVERWKIRYDDRENHKLINFCQVTGKEILISTRNAHTKRDEKIKLLYCVPEYPPAVIQLPEQFDKFEGFSSHYPDHQVPIMAMRRGAQIIEVHVKMNKYSDGWVPADDAVSINMLQLGDLVRHARTISRKWRREKRPDQTKLRCKK